MLLARIRQQSAETRRYDVSYSNRFRTGELLTAVDDVIITPVSTTPLTVTPFISADSTTAILYIAGGEDNTTYDIQVQVSTNDVGGVLWEDELVVEIEDV